MTYLLSYLLVTTVPALPPGGVDRSLIIVGQEMIGYKYTKNVDGADDVEWFLHNVLSEHPQVDITRMYEQEGVAPSRHTPDLPLTNEGFVAQWATGYGMVFWFGHGLERTVARTIWREDSDGDDEADAHEPALKAPVNCGSIEL